MKQIKVFLILNIILFLVSCGGGGGSDNADKNSNIDTTPDIIVFTEKSNVPLSSTITSNTAIITGINSNTNISIVNGEYSINNGMFLSNTSTVKLNDQIKVRHTSAVNNNTQTKTTLTIGGQSFEFISTTISSIINNTTPVANAGSDQSIITGNSVFLDGSASLDADGDPLTFLWSLNSAPSGSTTTIISETTSTPSITPDTDGVYTLNLVVNDGNIDSLPDTINITATSISNTAPVANAGLDIIVYVGTTAFLDGSNSSDIDGDTLTFQWSGTSPPGSTSSLFNINTAYPYFIPDVIGTYSLNLTVNDGTVDSLQDLVTVTAVSLPVSTNIVVYSGNTYLGCWSCNEFNSDSIHNSFSQYGSEFGSYSIRNNFGTYGSSFSSTSACNTFASSPPVIVDNNFYYGTMSINTYNSDSICNQFSSFYSSGDCVTLQNYCANL